MPRADAHTATPRPGPASTPAFPAWHGLALLGAVFALALANVLDFSARVANPVVTEDAWYYMDVFVAKDLAGELTWRDFFLKRDAADHSQPLHRLLLWTLLHAFDLDFWFEGLAGIAMLALCVLVLLQVALDGRPCTLPDAAIAALIPLILCSLNAQEIYFWPLVGLFYLVLPFALLVFVGAARAWSPLALSASALGMMVAMDGAGLLAGIAAACALLLAGARRGTLRRALPRAAAILGACIAYKVAYYAVMPPVPPPVRDAGTAFAALRDGLGDAWRWFVIPAAASIAHWDHFARWYGDDAQRMVNLVGAGVLVLHGAFWWSVLRARAEDPRTTVAVALMLFAYAMVAGVLLGRVPHLGVDYLWQHRYITGYQLANVALVLQWLALRGRRAPPAASTMPRDWLAPALTLGGFLLLQGELSWIADAQAPYIREYNANMAATLRCLAAHPQAEAVACQPNHQVCSWPVATRARLVGLLVEHRLNVFSPAVQARHRLVPDPAGSDLCLPRPDPQPVQGNP